ncbi:MAG: hypothetical protein GX053_05210, partial [Tissierella sp.]|nr:hypothetical protein [Tissierella sp.]
MIVRVELSSDDRIEIRGYMLNQESIISSESLIDGLKTNLRLEQFELVKKSLIKDVIHLNRTTNKDKQWQDHPYILILQNLLEIDDQQMETINEAIINDEEILKMRKNDSEIEKAMKDIASKAAAVGVPLAAIYLSGSVVGVSAAGITSGLAALGMKGLLGFSSMFTGIG